MFQNLLILFCCFVVFALFARPSICFDTMEPSHVSKISGMFAFGSSIVDNGNNNFLLATNSAARVDFLPYGIDFPGQLGPTGRYTNGKNVIDLLGEKLKLPNYVPPFNDPSTRGSKILHGVNYGSGGSGILDDTGAWTGNVSSLNQQINNFERVTLPDLKQQLGLGPGPGRVLGEFLFVIASGGNDYSLNYFLGLTNSNVTLEAFTANLTATFSTQLKRLYKLGARKFVLMSTNPNGCTPMARGQVIPTSNSCVEGLNGAVQMFNNQLRNLTDNLRPQMPSSKLVFVNAYKVITDIIRFPRLRGFRNVSNSCCEVTSISQGGTGILCRRGGSVCPNRNKYVYFDGVHLTETANAVVAAKAFASVLRDEVYPYNVKRLSEI